MSTRESRSDRSKFSKGIITYEDAITGERKTVTFNRYQTVLINGEVDRFGRDAITRDGAVLVGHSKIVIDSKLNKDVHIITTNVKNNVGIPDPDAGKDDFSDKFLVDSIKRKAFEQKNAIARIIVTHPPLKGEEESPQDQDLVVITTKEELVEIKALMQKIAVRAEKDDIRDRAKNPLGHFLAGLFGLGPSSFDERNGCPEGTCPACDARRQAAREIKDEEQARQYKTTGDASPRQHEDPLVAEHNKKIKESFDGL